MKFSRQNSPRTWHLGIKCTLTLLFTLLFFGFSNGQSAFYGSLSNNGYYSSSKDQLPFWFYSNQRGRVSAGTSLNSLLSASYKLELGNKSTIQFGGGILFDNGSSDRFVIDELYIDYTYDWLDVTLGRKQQKEIYNGLSSTNANILWSLNSRPMYGIHINTNRTLYLDKNQNLGIELTWEDYIQNEDAPTNDYVHHKSFHTVLNFNSNYSLKIGLNHFAQWGGTSPNFGKQPSKFSDYLRIISGSGGGEGATDGDQKNALGNHLGSWDLYFTRNFDKSKIQLIYNSIFDDASGRRLANFPDGRYGLFWESNDENRLVSSAIYEFYYTKHQSHDVNYWGADNYLNNGIFSYGWAYKDRVLGSPFFTYDKNEHRIVNNKFVAHHVGLKGNLNPSQQQFDYRFLMSYSINDGTYSRISYESIPEEQLNLFLQVNLIKRIVNLDILLASDFSKSERPNFGAGISMTKKF